MKSIKVLSLLIFALVLMISCTKEDADSEGNLNGTFNVTKVEGQRFVNGNPDFYLADNNPTGYIKFSNNGSGEQNYTFTIFGSTSVQQSNFTWTANESTINVDRFNDTDLVWERVVNEKSKQVASYDIIFDAQTTVKYTLTMEK